MSLNRWFQGKPEFFEVPFKLCIRHLAVFSLRVCGCGWSQVESETFRQEDTVPRFNVPLLKLSFQAVGDGALAKA